MKRRHRRGTGLLGLRRGESAGLWFRLETCLCSAATDKGLVFCFLPGLDPLFWTHASCSRPRTRVKPDFVQAFQEATIANAEASRKETGIVRFDLLQQADDPSRFLLVEAYLNEQATGTHKETQHYKTWRDTVAEMMAEPRQAVKFTNLDPPDAQYGYEIDFFVAMLRPVRK